MRVCENEHDREKSLKFMTPSFLKTFIEAYRSLPCLWKADHKDYCIKPRRLEALQQLIELTRPVIPEADAAFIKDKIRSIRNSVGKERKKVVTTKNSFIPKLWYYPLMTFLFEQKGDHGLKKTADTGNLLEYDNVDDPNDIEAENANIVESRQVFKAESQVAHRAEAAPIPERRQMKRHADGNAVDRSTADQCSPVRTVATHALDSRVEEDEYDAIGTIVATKLRRMNDRQRLIADKLVNDILFKGLFNELTTSTHIAD